MRKGAGVNYWLLGLLLITNGALSFFVFRAITLSRALNRVRRRYRRLRQSPSVDHSAFERVKRYDENMLALLAASPLWGLKRYARSRLPHQKNVEDILPSVDCDLSAIRNQKVERADFSTSVGRTDMSNHALRMRNWFSGKSELVYINALCIAYLRRRTAYTERARELFMRLWSEQGEFLAENLSTRWLLSSLMTFMDHGETDQQRVIGAVGIAFGNSVKIYEWERVARGGFAKDFDFENDVETGLEGVPGIGRLSIANADIFRNMLATYVDLALRDPVAGRVLITLLIRLHGADTVFRRLDDIKLAVDPAPDAETRRSRHWSFGVHPHEVPKHRNGAKAN